MTPPKPESRRRRVSLLRYARLFRRDILSAQPAHLFRAWMAEFRTPFFRSYLVNDPALIRTVLTDRPADFPKSDRVAEGLRPLLGDSVFVTNRATWERQRRIIDPAFEKGRLRDSFPAMVAAGQAAVARLEPGVVEVERTASHAAADVIFRTLFSIPIEDRLATQTFEVFRAYQRTQPILTPSALLPLPRWLRAPRRAAVRRNAAEIRRLIGTLTQQRAEQIADGTAPDDLATKIMTTPDPETRERFTTREMVDQVAIFFLAGHETSAATLGWALYLLATHPEAQARVAEEADTFSKTSSFANVSGLSFTRDVIRETLRLYPPVPMMVRQTTRAEAFRKRDLPLKSQIVLSPWHLHRHERMWQMPDDFDPDRWATDAGRCSARDAYLPFSTGPRVCPGAGFAMLEGPVLLALLVNAFSFEPDPDRVPVPQAHLTLRAKDGIWLNLARR